MTTPAESPIAMDHVFIWVSKDAPESSDLENLGLTRDPEVYRHVGQGTSSRVFWFEGLYLELIWPEDKGLATIKVREMGTELTQRTTSAKPPGNSPFGVGLVLTPSAHDKPPFEAISYHAKWMDELLGVGSSLQMAKSNKNAAEPIFFIVPANMAAPTPDALPNLFKNEPFLVKNYTHALGVKQVTGVRFVITDDKPWCKAASLLVSHDLAEFENGEAPLLELTFDHSKQGKKADLRPRLPLILSY